MKQVLEKDGKYVFTKDNRGNVFKNQFVSRKGDSQLLVCLTLKELESLTQLAKKKSKDLDIFFIHLSPDVTFFISKKPRKK